MRWMLMILVLSLVGCGTTPPQKSPPVTVTVTITMPNGQPGKNLTLLMLPETAAQVQGVGKTDSHGKTQVQLTPGKYTFVFESPPNTVPKKYHSNDTANAVSVDAATKELNLKLDN